MSTSSQPTTQRDRDAQQTETRQRFQRLRALIRNDTRRQRSLFLASLVALCCVAVLGYIADTPRILPFDLDTTLGLQAIRLRALRPFMIGISIFGYGMWPTITTTIGVLLIGALLGWKDGAYLLLITVIQGLCNLVIKLGVARVRPLSSQVQIFTETHGNSFPSGHVMFYTVFFGFLFFLAWTRLPRSLLRGIVLVLTGGLVLLVGPSRIYLGAHWLSDVLAAYLLGLIVLAFAIEFYVRSLAPRVPEQQGGLIGQQDRTP